MRRVLMLAVMVLVILAMAAPAMAGGHNSHKSCKGLGQAISAYAQDDNAMPGLSVRSTEAWRTTWDTETVGDVNKLFHSADAPLPFCVQK